ncbi:MAG: hypothetical protein ABW202_20495 [Duganella sp.]
MITRRQWLAAAAALPLASSAGAGVGGGAAAAATVPAVPSSASSIGSTRSTPDTLRFVFSRPLDNPRTQWLIRVYTQLLGELGMGFVFIDVPPKRATALVLNGEADGELGRTFDYQSLYPTLVRVAEPNNAVRFCAYAMRPGVNFDNWPALRTAGLRCEYRLGIMELENMLSRELPPPQVSSIPTIAQGLKKLRLNRTDLYFDVEEAVSDYLYFLSAAERDEAGLERLHQAGVVMATTGHAYLGPARAALAPQLAAGLARLKRQGDVQRHLVASLAAYKEALLRSGRNQALPATQRR